MKKNAYKLLAITMLMVVLTTACNQQRSDLVIAEFEDVNYGDWKVEGEAFGSGPSDGIIDEKIEFEGFEGKSLAISLNGGVESMGKLISPSFIIERKFINFLVAGGLSAGDVCINLIINNEVVSTIPDPLDLDTEQEDLVWATLDVSKWKGQSAVIEVVDQKDENWGIIAVDHFVQSDVYKTNPSFEYNASREVEFDKQYLNIPIKEGAGLHLMSILIDDKKVREFQLELAGAEPDYWMFLDVSDWQGKSGVIQIAKLSEESEGLQSIFVDQTVKGFETLYQEKDRPQFHFTSRRGWHNDPNGLVFYKGEYHLFYQHNPLGWPWGNMTWGHAISEDLVHWEEMEPALYADELGTEFSGSGVIDWNNTTGFQQGDEKPMVLMYTAAGGTSKWSEDMPFTQCLAYSLDKGRTFTKYEGNPVLGHIIDGNRDPKVAWYEPDQSWVMSLFLQGNNFGLFTSKDLITWTPIQEIIIEDGAECPDFFEIPLDGDPNNMKWVLTAANGRFLAGTFDGKKFTPETEAYASEFGENYYAVQSYSDIMDGRRIQFGWMAGSAFKGMPFNQQFSVARELTLRTTPGGIRLYGNPVREIEGIHGEKQSWSNLTVSAASNPLSELQGNFYHILAEFSIEKTTAAEFGFNLRGFEISYDTQHNKLTAHRPSDNATSEVNLLPENGKIRMEILLDRGSVELFANDGKVPMAFFYIPEEEEGGLSLECANGDIHLNSMDIYTMNSIWNKK
jgi:fructan beta-fructosidase